MAALAALTLSGLADASNHRVSGSDQRIVQGDEFADPVDDSQPSFFELTTDNGDNIVVREELADAEKGRQKRRKSIVYFGQLTDFQLADEESPARVEFLDQFARSAWRPQEAFHPFAIDESIKRVNAFLDSPFRQGNGDRARMDLALLTGDQADNMQFNETLWVRQLIEPNSKLEPGSGIEDFSSCDAAAQAALQSANLDEEPNYIGVQDYEEFERNEAYYDPNDPAGVYANWPRYRGLMDRAQEPFRTTGLKVPTYVINGNHDSLLQGNEDATQFFEDIAIGCVKPTVFPSGFNADASDRRPDPDPGVLREQAVTGPFVPPDPDRRFVSKGEVRAIFEKGQKDDHGFEFVDEDEDGPGAANGTAWYYAWNARPGLRIIAIDTVSEGGIAGPSAEGNIDDPQFQWLEDELEKAQEKNKLIVVTGHHPIRTLTSEVADEAAPQCAGGYVDGEYVGPDRDPKPGHNHALNPGCDADDRTSTPVHLGEDFTELLLRFPNVIAYVPGHTHENRILPFSDGGGDDDDDGEAGFWELNTSAVADWPQQSRLIEIMDNKDGTLSLLSVITDHASRVGIPEPGSAKKFNHSTLGSLGRTFSFNDPQSERFFGSGPPFGSEGEPEDRNVELLIDDPRDDEGVTPTSLPEGTTVEAGPGQGAGGEGGAGGDDDAGADDDDAGAGDDDTGDDDAGDDDAGDDDAGDDDAGDDDDAANDPTTAGVAGGIDALLSAAF